MQVDMEDLAKKYLKDYKTSKLKLNLPSSKFFLRVSIEEDVEVIKKCQDSLEIILRHDRVNKRNARAHAIWLPEKSLALVTKVVKSLLKSFGYQDKSGIYLYPEEILYLLETNKLEVKNSDGSSITIEEAYNLLQKCENCTINKYRAFKKLALLGYKLLRHEEIKKRLEKDSRNKRKCEKIEDTKGNKKMKTEHDQIDLRSLLSCEKESSVSVPCQTNESSSSKNEKTNEYITDMFSELRKSAPRERLLEDIKKPPDFYIFLPANNHRTNYDFKLYICNEDILTSKDIFSKVENIIYAMCLRDDISFYKFSSLHLQNL